MKRVFFVLGILALFAFYTPAFAYGNSYYSGTGGGWYFTGPFYYTGQSYYTGASYYNVPSYYPAQSYQPYSNYAQYQNPYQNYGYNNYGYGAASMVNVSVGGYGGYGYY